MYTVGSGNPFAQSYSDQCTYWAQERYHQLTGIWTPCIGNAFEWAGEARAAGWKVTSSPPSIPSIICLQAGAGQGLLSNFGHVAVVEKVNPDGSVKTSNYNWPIGTKNTTVTFHQGPGVSFIFADYNAGQATPVQKIQAVLLSTKRLVPTYTLSANQTMSDFLANVDGAFVLINPFDISISNVSGDVNTGDGYPNDTNNSFVSFTDPVQWLNQLGLNIMSDAVALTLRIICVILGVYILFRVMDHYVHFNQIVETVSQSGI